VGSLILPANQIVFVDTASVIYTIEHHPVYEQLLQPLWDAQAAGSLRVAASERVVLEALVVPVRSGDASLVSDYEALLFQSALDLIPITRQTLLHGAELRAGFNLRTPDALHAAAALDAGAALFVTNDPHFRRVPGLNVAVLDDLLP
jgi:predicted nucleic acid-binding protein